MDKPLVSVIIPTYNRETFLRQAIYSVANQSYSPIEILVIDDGSSSNYAEAICETFENCQYYYKENGGLSSARNFGLKKAKGVFIGFLDDDDFWREDKIEKQLAGFEVNPDVYLVHSSAMVINQTGNLTGDIIGAVKEKAHLRSGNVFWNALGTWVVKSPTPLIRREVFENGFLFDENIKVGEDVDFYQRLFYRHKVLYLDEPLAYYRVYDDQSRLSLQRKRYVGMEQKMFDNFVKMKIDNPLILYRIARRILNFAINNWKSAYPEKSLKISKFNKLLRPQWCLKNCFNH